MFEVVKAQKKLSPQRKLFLDLKFKVILFFFDPSVNLFFNKANGITPDLSPFS
jgi:hypothetical protein